MAMQLVVVFSLEPAPRSPYRDDGAADAATDRRLLDWREPRAAALACASGVELAPRMLPAAGPFVLASYPDPSAARGCLERVRAEGFDAGVVAADRGQLDRALECRSARVEGGKVLLEIEGSRAQLSLEPGQVRLLLRGVRSSIDVSSARQSALAGAGALDRRGQLPPGVLLERRESMLYVRAGLGRPLLLVDQQLDYRGLGQEMRATAAANFVTVVDQLRLACRRAIFDQRLTSRAQQSALLGPLPSDDYFGVAFAVLEASHSSTL